MVAIGRSNALPLPLVGVRPSKLRIFCQLLVILYLTYKLSCTVFASFANTFLEVKIYLLGVSMFFVTGLFPCVFFWSHGKTVRRMLDNMDTLNERIMNARLGKEDHFEGLYTQTVRTLDAYSKWMAYATIGCAAFYCTSVPVLDWMDGNYGLQTAVPPLCPFEKDLHKIRGVFETIVVEQIIAYTIPGFLKYITDYLMVGLVKTHAAYFSYLCLSFGDIGKELVSEGRISKRLIVWTQLHQDVCRSYSGLRKVVSPLILMYCLCTIVSVAGSLIYQFEAKDSNALQAIFGGSYMSMNMVQLFFICQAADQVATQGRNVGVEVYRMRWDKVPANVRKHLTMIIAMTNRALHFEGYMTPSFRLNKETYLALFVNTISAYMAFRKIKTLNAEELTTE